jgi:hypothetical protein
MGTDDVCKLKALEQENNWPKKILAERDLEIEVMKEMRVKSGERADASGAGSVGDWPGCYP